MEYYKDLKLRKHKFNIKRFVYEQNENINEV